MDFNVNADLISDGIKLALAPVFLLTAVANLVSALTQRLSRVVDRARVLHHILLSPSPEDLPLLREHQDELKALTHRGWLINLSIALVVFCGMMIGMTVLALFFGEAGEHHQVSVVGMLTFVIGIGSFVASLILLLVEVLVASYSIRLKPYQR
jgi:hypothetical protein